MAPKLGEILIGAKVIDQHQLDSALSVQQKWGGKLGEILVNKGLCSEEMLVKALSRQLDIPRPDLDKVTAVPDEVLSKISLEMSMRLDVVPLELRDGGAVLAVAMGDPMNTQSISVMAESTGCRIHPLLAGPQSIARCRARLYKTGACQEPAPPANKGRSVVLGGGEYGNRETVALGRQTAALSVPPVHKAESPAVAAPLIPEGATGPEILRALVQTLVDKGVFTQEEFSRNLTKQRG